MKKIRICVSGIDIPARLNDSETARRIWASLPLEGTASLWGDEIYFEINVDVEPAADARAEVEVGELGYWPLGPAFCIFFGPTPASEDHKPRAYSPVNVFGRVTEDPGILRSVPPGAVVRVTPGS